MEKRVVGMDLGIRAPSVAVVAETDGTILGKGKALRFKLSIEELERVEAVALEGAEQGVKLHVVMEASYPTSEYVSAFFRARGHEVSFAKPNQVKEFRKCLSPKVKTDEVDAYVMARLPWLDPKQLARGHVPSPATQELKMQVSQRASMVRQLVTLKNQLLAYANAIWPGISNAFGDLDSAHARAFLREQTSHSVVELQAEGLEAFLGERGRIQPSYARRLANKLMVIAQTSRGLHQLLSAGQLESNRAHTIELIDMVEDIELRLRAKEKRLDKAYRRCDPERLLMTIPGIAAITAPTIFSYFGEPERFPTARKAQGFVGLFPETDATGLSDRKGTHITKAGPALLRRDLFLAADHFRRLDPDGARLYHDLMVLRGNHHNSALCTIANRMLIPRILTVLREQRPYQFRNLDGTPFTKAEARQLAAQWKVTQEVRKRLRNSKPLAQKSRERTPNVTSEPMAPRNGRPSRPTNPNSELLSVTKAQLASLVFRTLESMLNAGENIEEIRFQLKHQAAIFFQERS
jgi:transposase